MAIQPYSSTSYNFSTFSTNFQDSSSELEKEEKLPEQKVKRLRDGPQGVDHLLTYQKNILNSLLEAIKQETDSKNFFEKFPFYKTMMTRFVHGLCAITKSPKISEKEISSWLSSTTRKGKEKSQKDFTSLEAVLSELTTPANSISPMDILELCNQFLENKQDKNSLILKRCLIAYPLCIFPSLTDMPGEAEVEKQLTQDMYGYSRVEYRPGEEPEKILEEKRRNGEIASIYTRFKPGVGIVSVINSINQRPSNDQMLYPHQLRQFFSPKAQQKRIGWELVSRNSNREHFEKTYPQCYIEFTDTLSLDFFDLVDRDDYYLTVHSTSLLKAPWVINSIASNPLSWLSCSLVTPHTSYYIETHSRPYPVGLILDVDPKSIVLTESGDTFTPTQKDPLEKIAFADACMRKTAWKDYQYEHAKNTGEVNSNSLSYCAAPFLGITELTEKTRSFNAQINENVILGSLARDQMSQNCTVKGLVFRTATIRHIMGDIKQGNSGALECLKKIQQSKLPLLLIHSKTNEYEPVSSKYRLLKERFSTLEMKLDQTSNIDEQKAIKKKLDICSEEIYEFEHECIQKKSSPKFWLANQQLQELYQHLATFKDKSLTESQRMKISELIEETKSLDKKLRDKEIAHHPLETQLFDKNAKMDFFQKRQTKHAQELLDTGLKLYRQWISTSMENIEIFLEDCNQN